MDSGPPSGGHARNPQGRLGVQSARCHPSPVSTGAPAGHATGRVSIVRSHCKGPGTTLQSPAARFDLGAYEIPGTTNSPPGPSAEEESEAH